MKQNCITEAYSSFSENPCIVHHSSRNIFLVPLEDRLKQDLDSLQCFLHSYNLAGQQQDLMSVRYPEAAAQFFFPRSLPTTIIPLGVCDISTCSSCTYASGYILASSGIISADLSQLDQSVMSRLTHSIDYSTHLDSVALGSQPESTHTASNYSTISSSTAADLDDGNSDVALSFAIELLIYILNPNHPGWGTVTTSLFCRWWLMVQLK
jgi:hypothetical protein